MQYIHTQLNIWLFHLSHHATLKTRQETFVHAFQFYRSPVADKYYAFAVKSQVIEYMEKSILRFRSCHPFLHIIHDEHINGLIEGYEIVKFAL